MAVGKKKAVLMKAVSELKAEDYSKMPELEGIYKRLASGRKQFAEVLDKNIKAVMQISSLDLTMQHHTDQPHSFWRSHRTERSYLSAFSWIFQSSARTTP